MDLLTLLERKQVVHTYIVLGTPFTIALTRLIFGFHVLLVLLTEWLTLFPNLVSLLQI